MGLLCIQRTLDYGVTAGLGTGLAAATVQVFYGTMALLGLSPMVLAFVGASASVLFAASGVVLLWFALRTARGKAVIPAASDAGNSGLLRSFRDALAVGFTNPMAVALFLAASPALGWADTRIAAACVVAGIFTGVIGWYATLSGAVSIARRRLSASKLARTKQISAAVLIVLAAYMFANAVRIQG